MATKQLTLLDVQVKRARYFFTKQGIVFFFINYDTRKEVDLLVLSYVESKQPIFGLNSPSLG